MEIRTMQISELTPAQYNPRKALKPSDREYIKLKRSLDEFGYVDPIIWNERTGNIVGGHQRLTVLKDSGVTEIDVNVIDVDADKEKALNVALNKISGDWDVPMLADLLEELQAVDLADLTGFDQSEIEALLNGQAGEDVIEDGFDAADAARNIIEPVAQRGGVWVLGRHRLMCGDSTVIDDVEKLMGGNTADCVFTDPPYNVDYKGGTKEKKTILNDNMADSAFYQFLYDAFLNMAMVSKPGCGIYICHADSEGYNFRKAMLDAGWLMKQCIIWAKNSMVLGRQDYQWRHEPILYGWKPGAAHKWNGGRKQTTVWEDAAGLIVTDNGDHLILSIQNGVESVSLKVPSLEVLYAGNDEGTTIWRFEKPMRNGEHPTMKPIGIPARAIKNSSSGGAVVLDLFGGSGSTLIACEQLNRICYMMELDPVYCDVIIKRWEEFTGQKAELLKGGD